MEEEKEDSFISKRLDDPFRDDPVFHTTTDMYKYLNIVESSSSSGEDDVEVATATKVCLCKECSFIVTEKGLQHSCCQELKHLWINKINEAEMDNSCLTLTNAFRSSLNPYAIRYPLLCFIGVHFEFFKMLTNFPKTKINGYWSRPMSYVYHWILVFIFSIIWAKLMLVTDMSAAL